MTTKKGNSSHDPAQLRDPIAQELLHSRILARLAYVWSDGTPRVIPIAFHWDGHDMVFGTPPNAPKAHLLKDGSKVAITIDSNDMPFKALSIRGIAKVSLINGIVPEYSLACKRYMGEEGGNAWLAQIGQMLAHPKMGGKMLRIAVTPEWVNILDFQQRFPSAIAAVMAG